MTKHHALSALRPAALFALALLFGLAAAPFPAHGAEKAKAAAKPAAKSAKPAAKPAAKSSKAKKQEEPVSDRLPWSMRDRYTFTSGPLQLDFAKDDGEWRVRVKSEGQTADKIVVKDVGFAIELAGGRVLKHDEIYKMQTTMEREKYTGDVVGGGTRYTVQYGAVDGLVVSHRLSTFESWPFVTFTVLMRNDSAAPVTVNRVVTASFNAGGIMGLGPETKTRSRFLQVRGGYPLFCAGALPIEMMFQDPATGHELSFGVVPTGLAEAGVDLQSSGGAWQGRIASDYKPGHVVKPGETFEADTIWVSYGAVPFQSDTQFSWLLRNMKWPAKPETTPRAWVTVPDTESLAALVSEAASAQSYGVLHALVPSGWESKPGSLEGGAPRWPRDIGRAAKELRGAGCTPGITVDPLAVQGSVGQTAKSADGQTWANPADPATAAALLKRVQKLIDEGFGFIVVERSHIPDEVLAGFGMSRVEAEWRAVGVVSAAAASGGKVCVFPASETKVKPERDAWLEAAAAVARTAEFGTGVGPVTLEAKGLGAIDNDLATAIRLWQGPIEILGTPGTAARATLGDVLHRDPLRARPMDILSRSPLLWQMRMDAPGLGYVGTNVIAFNGAPAWNIKDAEPGEAIPTFAWAPDGDKVTVPKDGMAPASTRMTVMGLCPELTRPTFMGVSEGFGFGLDKLKSLSWDDQKSVLRVEMTETLGAKTRGYVALTPGWKAKNVKVGGERVKPTAMDEKWLVFPMNSGSLEIEFEKAK